MRALFINNEVEISNQIPRQIPYKEVKYSLYLSSYFVGPMILIDCSERKSGL